MSKKRNDNEATPLKTETVVQNENRFHKGHFFILTGILLLTIFVFGTLSKSGFFWDDYDYIINNPHMLNLSLSTIFKFFSSFYNANYHPLTTLSWALEYHFFGLNPGGYHNTGIVLHLINSILVFYFARLLTKDIRVATVTVVLFAIHPMHVESVAWISERKDLLYTLFYLLSTIFYLNYLEKKNWKILVWVFFFFVLSCLSKSAAITLPLILILLDYYKDNLSSKSLLQKIPFLLISIVFGIVAIISQKTGGAINDDVLHFGVFDRTLLLGYSLCYYIASFFVPEHFYPKSGIPLPSVFYVTTMFVVLLLGFVLLVKKYRKELVFGFAFYLIGVSLVIQIIPLGKSLVSERYSYVPYIGLSIMLAKILFNGISSYGNRKRNLTIVYVILGIGVAILSIQSYKRCKVWINADSLFTDVIEKNPQEGYAYWLHCYNRIQENDYAGCIADCDRGLAVDSTYTVLYANRAVAKFYIADYRGAIYDYTKMLQHEPKNAQALYNRAKAKSQLKDYAGAVQDFENAFKQKGFALNATGYVELAIAKLMSNDARGAIIDLDKSLVLNPQSVDAYFSKGNCYYQLKNYKEAIKNYSQALQIDPRHHNALCNRGIAKTMIGDVDGACADFKISMELGNVDAGKNYAHCK